MSRLPEKILVSNNDIDIICEDNIKRNNEEKIFIFLLGIIIPSWLSFVLTEFQNWNTGKIVYITILVILTIITGGMFLVVLRNKKHKSIAEQIRKKADDDSDYSALFIISRIKVNSDGKKKVEVLVQEKKTWNCLFLPYWDINKNASLEEQSDILCKGVASKLNIQSKDVKIYHLQNEGCYSIKVSVPEHTEKLFRYEFYMVTISSYLEYYLLENQKWADIDSLANNVNIVRINGDVVDKLISLKSRMGNSFVPYDRSYNDIKIIWNITKKCLFNCMICATQSEIKRELSENEKARALLSIATMRDCIRELNFAGGDPLVCAESKKIIKYAMDLIDKNKVSISTTGKGIERLSENEKIVFLNNCVLSMDNVDFEKKGVRNSNDYNRINVRNSKRYRNYMSKLRINVPIIRTDLEKAEIQKLAENINIIQPDEVSLLRLMPVGRQKGNKYPTNYNPQEFVRIFRKLLNPNIKLHIHCSLRCLCSDEKEQCTMLTRKVGIDCEGNVFACCWAGYLDCTLNDNPFYLGNLLNDDLKEILRSNKALEILEQSDRNQCSVFNYNNVTIKSKL